MNFGFSKLIENVVDSRNSVESLAIGSANQKLLSNGCINGIMEVPVYGDDDFVKLIEKTIKILALEIEPSVRISNILISHSVPLTWKNRDLFDLLDRLGLEQTSILNLSGQPCAVMHQTVASACHSCANLSPKDAVIVIGIDIALSSDDRFFFGSVMGDCCIGGVIEHNARSPEILASWIDTNIIADKGELSPKNEIDEFRSLNPILIKSAICACLSKIDMDITDLDWIFPHTPYTSIWDSLAGVLQFPREQIVTDYICSTGHLSSNDSFSNLAHAYRIGKICNGEVALLVNPGFGGTRGCTIVRYS